MTQAMSINELLTFQDIERALPRIKSHQIAYMLRTRNIPPLCMLGHARVYGPYVIERLQQEFDEMNEGRDSA